MDKEQARAIVKNTFENPFDKSKFSAFIRNLLNHIEEATFSHRGYVIPDAYEQNISSFERIGKYTDGENRIDIIVVRLKRETSIERARSLQRNFVARVSKWKVWHNFCQGSRSGGIYISEQ